jgi:HEAT repeat protein
MALGRLGAPAVPALSEVLKENDSRVQALAASALRRIGPEAKAAVPNLIAVLKEEKTSAATRIQAIDALGRIGPEAKDAVPALIHAVQTKDKDPLSPLRLHATIALGQIGPVAKEAVPALMEALKEKGRGGLLRIHAAEALGAIGPDAKAAIPAVKEMLADRDLPGRDVVTRALEKIQGTKSGT